MIGIGISKRHLDDFLLVDELFALQGFHFSD